MMVDPVCRKKMVDGGRYCSQFNEERYCFCSRDCAEQFDAMPILFLNTQI
ncbi:MAG TPA: YHS domain-containing protein [Candidatus Lokiarchaeia archaeon]|nr:YHS domain-containing protein [Candidatus Lokiarchaeia archaeon]